MRILAISAPGDDRGPGVMYRNHLRALAHPDSEISVTSLTQEIWESDHFLRDFDVAWGYVRFHPQIAYRMRSLGIPVIGGPNIVMERADAGITDEYERWYLTQQSVDMNLNVAQYYSDHVKKFVTNGMRCEVLEGCYDIDVLKEYDQSGKDIDVLLYQKVRVNDSEIEAKKRLDRIDELLKNSGLKTHTIIYGSYSRDEYLELCSRSRTVAWLSIEDYASLAQIEAHLLGACVIGTPYNLTIPALDESICARSQDMKNWVFWREAEQVASDYVSAIERVLNVKDTVSVVRSNSYERHGFKRYRQELTRLIRSLK